MSERKGYLCFDCGHKFTVPKGNAKYKDGTNCTKCNGRLLPVTEDFANDYKTVCINRLIEKAGKNFSDKLNQDLENKINHKGVTFKQPTLDIKPDKLYGRGWVVEDDGHRVESFVKKDSAESYIKTAVALAKAAE